MTTVHALPVIVLTALALALQSVVAPRLAMGGVRPDWLLVVVVFFGLYAPPHRAAIAGWLVGLCADLMTVERLGVLSLSYGLTALTVISVREHLFRYRAATQFALTLIMSVFVRTAWTVYARVLYGWGTSLWLDGAAAVVWGSAYTAIWAPFIHRALFYAAPYLGLPKPRHAPNGLVEVTRAHV